MLGLDGDFQTRVFLRSLRRFGVSASMKTTARHAKNAVQNGDRVFGSQYLHDPYFAASPAQRKLPLSYDIAQLAHLGLKLKHGAATRGYVG
jgi:hypothetical protein